MANYFMNTYHRLPLTFTRGEGVWLYDTNGRAYLDFTSGIGVNCLGHKHPALVGAITRQAEKLLHTCNYYQSDTALEFAEKLVKAAAGMKTVFLCNSGAEANEGACKIARKYSLKKYGPGRHTIVTLKGSFHGRTITTLSATGQERFHRDFGPFTEGFIFVEGGDLAALEKALDQKTVAGLLLEAVQGESGIRSQTGEYIQNAAKLCAERDILLMFDEIQCGLGRTGTFLACEQYGVKADVVTLAKALAGGIPAGAFLAGEKAADVLQPGDHGATFGGNPLACAAGIAVLDIVTNPAFLGEIKRKGEKMKAALELWKHPRIREVRSRGLMLGIDIDTDARQILEAAAMGTVSGLSENPGLLILSSGAGTLRFLPPYIISDAEIDQGLEILKEALGS
ncbi:MAG: aspartate aminotransferase family protein [Spirochaetaceae bacterium]|jgi:acetylornithine/N-succinyldiaminopimelate aminotransferase|nr:aspartate aminotransferase family protein [Spirochaetaceae bacterium]